MCLYLEEEATELASGSYKPVGKGGAVLGGGGRGEGGAGLAAARSGVSMGGE